MDKIIKVLGTVTAYGDALKAGYTGSHDEWVQLQMRSGMNAQRAEDAANAADASAQRAAEYETSTSVYAHNASIAAETAAESQVEIEKQANNAQEYVRIAEDSATNAAGSAYAAQASANVAAASAAEANAVKESIPADYTALTQEVGKLSEEVDEIADAVMPETLVTVGFDYTEEKYIYSSNFPNGTALAGYNTYNKTVSAGETYYINTTVVAASGYSVCVFYNAGKYVKISGSYPTYSGAVTGYEVVIPEGVDTLKITAATNAAVSLQKKVRALVGSNASPDKIFVTISDNKLYTKSAYGAGKDITAYIGKRGGNSLPDFVSFAISDNSNVAIDKDAAATVFLAPSTDWHSPYIVQAVNNADGDMPSGYAGHFTGGNHEYTNTGTGGTATARCDVLKYYVNGKEVSEYEGYADTVKVFWRSYVQGNNTKKADGSGREILYEEHTLTFDGKEWISEVEFVPLEDVIIKRWYGLQICGLSSTRYSKIRYIDGEDRTEYAVNVSSSSGNAACTGMIAEGDMHRVTCTIDSTYDLGNRSFYPTGNQGAFCMAYGKSYFTVIDGSNTFAAGNHYYLRGKYRFEQMP